MTSLFARVSRRVVPSHVRHVAAVPHAAGRGLVSRVYADLERDFGMIAPPVALHAPAPEMMAACWLLLRETLLVPGPAGRAAKEAVAAAVSLGNRCPYCVEAHAATLMGLVGGTDARAVADDRIGEVPDPRLRRLARWGRASGGPDPGELPFGTAEAPELIGIAVVFHYFNRMVNIFLQESPLPPVQGRARDGVRRAAAGIMGHLAGRPVAAGESLGLLPPAGPPPADLSWTTGRPHLADAAARAVAAVEAAAEAVVPAAVREVVRAAPVTTDGPLGRDWLAARVDPLPVRERAAARLGLLTALASHQVTDAAVDACRDSGYGDAELVTLTGWSALTAARRIGVRLQG